MVTHTVKPSRTALRITLKGLAVGVKFAAGTALLMLVVVGVVALDPELNSMILSHPRILEIIAAISIGGGMVFGIFDIILEVLDGRHRRVEDGDNQ